MKRILDCPRLVMALASAAVIASLAAVPTGQAPQSAPSADDAARFTGATSALDAAGMRATRRRFEAAARSAWHSHERGQLLFVEEGKGRVQRRGQPLRELSRGESDYTGPNVQHWHGAAPDQAIVQAAMSWGGETRWMEKVTDAEYLGTTSAAQQQRPAGAAAAQGGQQPPPVGLPAVPLGTGPYIFDTAEQPKIRVVVTKGLSRPWSLAFLPDGGMLVTERAGRLRVIRNGVLDPQPITGVPKVHAQRLAGLLDVALHPRFAENRLVYLTYTKADEKGVTTALARGRLDGNALTEVRDIFVADAYGDNPGAASRMTFGRDGLLYMTIGGAVDDVAQKPNDHTGKIVRLRDDGSVPPDNPFVGKAGYKPEIYSLGHRNQLGLAVHPLTGAVWEHENGPNGGDEINILLPGRNYGWPLVSWGRTYEGPRVSQRPTKEGLEDPLLVWIPSIAPSGLAFYTGERFPKWKGNVFVGALRFGEVAGTGHLQRIVFNDKTEEMRRELLLTELRQRIRDVRQGPDGLLYVLTDEDDGAMLRIEPV
jgi:aldose sugar dehydrogenase